MEEESKPKEAFKLGLLFFLIICLFLAAFIGLGIFFSERENIGPCEQYTNQDAAELCADSVYNG